MIYARDDHSSTLLADGTVLLAGGEDQSGIGIYTAELFRLHEDDPDPPEWTGSPGVLSVLDLADCPPALELQWEPAVDVQSPPVFYRIYRSPTSPVDPAEADMVGHTTELFFIDYPPQGGIEYYYLVHALDASFFHNEDTNTTEGIGVATPGGQIPAVLGNTFLLRKEGQDIVMNVAPSAGALEYRFFRDEQKEAIGQTLYGQTVSPEYRDNQSLSVNQPYFFKARGLDACGLENE